MSCIKMMPRPFAFSRRMARFTIAPELLPRHQSFVSTSALQMTSCLQLIQYAPSTIEVKRRPLIIVPPWINKFYVLDLRPETSFIKWAVDQGHRVFVISRRTIWPWPAGMGGMGIMACRWFGQSTRAGGPLQPIEDAPGSYVRARIHTAAGSQGNTHSEMPGLFALPVISEYLNPQRIAY